EELDGKLSARRDWLLQQRCGTLQGKGANSVKREQRWQAPTTFLRPQQTLPPKVLPSLHPSANSTFPADSLLPSLKAHCSDPQSPSASVPQSPPTGITRTNAIRRRPRLDLNDIKINGDLVNRALGLTSNSNSSPAPIAIRQIPPMKPSLSPPSILLDTSQTGATMAGPHNLSSPTADTPPQSPTFPASFRQFHIPSRLTATVTQSPPAAIPQSPSASVPQSPPTGITRTNAIRRRPRLDLNDIKINGDLVNRALGLTSNSNSSPAPIAIRQIPPMKPSLVDYSTLPLPPLPHPFQIPQSSSRRPKSSRRRHGLIIMIPADLPQELRDLQLDAS
ncbi:hypothetical protein PSTT_12113, partial [Puccinia striiformis]